ncbi:MAG: glycoside hydrolase family 127 protein, partial [Gemmatimonadales bacterium]|nr:glycoside hydrolase family 127 protein [Gemmatimonadales bacterium]
ELYNMGHLLAAACVHHRATGKDNFLCIARKLGDYLCTVFLPRPKELAHFGFNPSNIMGAAELYRTT